MACGGLSHVMVKDSSPCRKNRASRSSARIQGRAACAATEAALMRWSNLPPNAPVRTTSARGMSSAAILSASSVSVKSFAGGKACTRAPCSSAHAHASCAALSLSPIKCAGGSERVWQIFTPRSMAQMGRSVPPFSDSCTSCVIQSFAGDRPPPTQTISCDGGESSAAWSAGRMILCLYSCMTIVPFAEFYDRI